MRSLDKRAVCLCKDGKKGKIEETDHVTSSKKCKWTERFLDINSFAVTESIPSPSSESSKIPLVGAPGTQEKTFSQVEPSVGTPETKTNFNQEQKKLSGCKKRTLRKLRRAAELKEECSKGSSCAIHPSRLPDTTTPPCLSKNKSKKRQSEGTSTISKVAAGIKLAVVPENFPEELVDLQQGNILIQALVDKMLELEERAPSFIRMVHENGAVIVVALNEESAVWLKTIIPTLRLWEGAELKIVHASEI